MIRTGGLSGFADSRSEAPVTGGVSRHDVRAINHERGALLFLQESVEHRAHLPIIRVYIITFSSRVTAIHKPAGRYDPPPVLVMTNLMDFYPAFINSWH